MKLVDTGTDKVVFLQHKKKKTVRLIFEKQRAEKVYTEPRRANTD